MFKKWSRFGGFVEISGPLGIWRHLYRYAVFVETTGTGRGIGAGCEKEMRFSIGFYFASLTKLVSLNNNLIYTYG
jgi:hypothetical protein